MRKLSEDVPTVDHRVGPIRRNCSSEWTKTKTANCRKTNCPNSLPTGSKAQTPTKTDRSPEKK